MGHNWLTVCLIGFGNKHGKSLVNFFWHAFFSEKMLNKIHNQVFNLFNGKKNKPGKPSGSEALKG